MRYRLFSHITRFITKQLIKRERVCRTNAFSHLIVCPTARKQKKQDSRVTVLHMLALPIFPGRLQPSIVGRIELNFRVRDGNGWTLNLINTNFVDTSSASLVSAVTKTQSLRCVSSSNHKRFAGLRFEFLFFLHPENRTKIFH